MNVSPGYLVRPWADDVLVLGRERPTERMAPGRQPVTADHRLHDRQ
ncbi:hypothetical protein ACFOZ7_14540 [Natribaculum luteum]|uniref:Uncharacterized protein n=1 Tax=Natribaculum luteum TaxID=1586232 RepID=A0ABD5P1R4_9EURY|nr:hypothetical protein [Natribaculum luteum]